MRTSRERNYYATPTVQDDLRNMWKGVRSALWIIVPFWAGILYVIFR